METKFEGMFAGFLFNLSNPSPSTSPSTIPVTDIPLTHPTQSPDIAPAASTPMDTSQSSATQPPTTTQDINTARDSSASVHSSSASTTSSRSYSSDVERRQSKKPRGSIHSDMSHLSLHPLSDNESEYSKLGDIYSGPTTSPTPTNMAIESSAWSPSLEDVPSSPTLQQSPPLYPPNVALPDLDNQYNPSLAPDGGDTG